VILLSTGSLDYGLYLFVVKPHTCGVSDEAVCRDRTQLQR
jgi:hypothetical protein